MYGKFISVQKVNKTSSNTWAIDEIYVRVVIAKEY